MAALVHLVLHQPGKVPDEVGLTPDEEWVGQLMRHV